MWEQRVGRSGISARRSSVEITPASSGVRQAGTLPGCANRVLQQKMFLGRRRLCFANNSLVFRNVPVPVRNLPLKLVGFTISATPDAAPPYVQPVFYLLTFDC